jgi:hypothetical protein
MNNVPRPYDLSDREEVKRLMREVRGYLHTCRIQHHGTDFEGRLHAIDAVEKLASGKYEIDLWEKETADS